MDINNRNNNCCILLAYLLGILQQDNKNGKSDRQQLGTDRCTTKTSG